MQGSIIPVWLVQQYPFYIQRHWVTSCSIRKTGVDTVWLFLVFCRRQHSHNARVHHFNILVNYTCVFSFGNSLIVGVKLGCLVPDTHYEEVLWEDNELIVQKHNSISSSFCSLFCQDRDILANEKLLTAFCKNCQCFPLVNHIMRLLAFLYFILLFLQIGFEFMKQILQTFLSN